MKNEHSAALLESTHELTNNRAGAYMCTSYPYLRSRLLPIHTLVVVVAAEKKTNVLNPGHFLSM